MASQTIKKTSFYLFILCIIGLTAKFWHIIYGVSDKEGMFGYKYMSSFLYAIGNEVAFLSLGLILVYAASKTNEYKRAFTRLGYLAVFVACFFIIQVLFPKHLLVNAFGIKDWHPSFYYVAMALMSVFSGGLVVTFQKAMMFTEEKLKEKIRILIDFIVGLRPNINDIEVYDAERIEVFKK